MKSYTNQVIRLAILLLILAICLSCIALFFWKQELQYQKPTPVPTSYNEINVGAIVNLPSTFKKRQAQFIHFYNPDCPCSRFNARHLKDLIGEFKDSVVITIVVPGAAEVAEAKAAFGGSLNIVTDEDGSIARVCGVYSTPQAAIIDQQGKLYYRGNYNSSRYCTSRASNFAELSLIALIHNQPSPSFGLQATQSYGCSLDQSSQVNLVAF